MTGEKREIISLTENNTSDILFVLLYIFLPCCHGSPLLAADTLVLRSYVHGKGHAAKVAVSGWIINDALPVQFALHLEVSVIVNSGETHRHHWGRVVYLWCGHDRRWLHTSRAESKRSHHESYSHVWASHSKDSTSGQMCSQGKTGALPTPREVLSERGSGYLFISLLVLVPCDSRLTTPIWNTWRYCNKRTEKRENIGVPWLHRSHWLVCLGQVTNLESVKWVRI